MNKTNLHVVFDRTELGVKVKTGWRVYPYENIIEIHADAHYSAIIISKVKVPVCVDVPLKILAENLPLIFFRYSRSGIVNLGYMQSYSSKGKNIEITATNGTCYTVSRYLKASFGYRMETLTRRSFPCEKCKTCTKRETCDDMTPFTVLKDDMS
jgi:DNA-binding LytR/AlgR family response regulator